MLRAAHALSETAEVSEGVAIRLTKNLPVAAGIGGGSADAAATLRLLMELWRLDMNRDVLKHIAITLGADVPACLSGETLRAAGIGEQLEVSPALPPMEIVLVNNGRPMNTASVFRAHSGSGPTCFAIFETRDAASTAASRLSKAHPDWWIRASRFRDRPATIEDTGP